MSIKRWPFLLLFLATTTKAGPLVSPSTVTVNVGTSVTFISTDTITCALTAGSTGTLSGCTYTAPASFQPHNVIDGCVALPNDHIYNTPINNLPLDPNSNTIIGHILGGTSAYIQVEPDIPHNIYNQNTPTQNMVFDFTPNNNGPFPFPGFPYMAAENSVIPEDFTRDMHIPGVSTNTCTFSELYKVYPVGTNGDCPSTCNATSGVIYNGMSYALADTSGGSGGGTDAAGMYVAPLLVRYSELKAGVIKHALRFSMDNGDIFAGFTWPAVANANPSCSPVTSCLQYGSRLRLKSSFNISSYSPTTQVILQALKTYGMFMADGGTAMHIQMASDVYRDTTTFQALQSEIRFQTAISQWAFEVVDSSTVEVSSSTGKVNISNPFVTPDIFAELVATKTSDSSTTTVRIALNPVTVGTENLPFPAGGGPSLQVMAGTPGFQIPYWVKGNTTTVTATFSMSPAIGSLTSGGMYTAPASQINSLSTATVTVTPVADSTNAITFPLTIYPSDAIRINVGGKSAANSPAPPYDANGNYGPDKFGKYWWSDPLGTGTNWLGKKDTSFAQNLWVSSNTDSDIGLFYTCFTGMSDGAYAVMVPNGSYFLKMGFAIGDPGNGSMAGVNESIDTQGATVISTGTYATSVSTLNYVENALTIPIKVINNQFYFAMRSVKSSSGTIIDNWSLTPTILGEKLKQGGLQSQGGIQIR